MKKIQAIFYIVLNILIICNGIYGFANAIIGTNPYINALWFFDFIIMICCFIWLNKKNVIKILEKSF